MHRLVGKSIARIDGFEKVTGKGKYAGDLICPDTLHLCLARAPVAHARIKSINTEALEKQDQVYCFTAKDIPENTFGNLIKDQPVLAHDRIRFYGEPYAVVAAPTPEAAAFWAGQIHLDFEALPVVDDPEKALEKESSLVHKQGNLLQPFMFSKREVEKGFAESTLILEDRFSVPMMDHAYMEPEAGISYWDNEVLTIKAGTQNPFHDQAEIARCFSLPLEKIRVTAPLVGGGFGGKDGVTVQLYLALVTIKTNRPAKLVFSREESLLTSYKRHPAKMSVRMGFSGEGKILAYQAKLHFDTGAYAALGPAVLGLGVEHCTGPYAIAHVNIEAWLVYTNKPPASAMRGFGAPQTLFATETLLNRAAATLKMDPVQLRWVNALEKGGEGTFGQKMAHSVGIKEALFTLKNAAFWQERSKNQDPLIGYGVAAGWLSCGLGAGIKDEAQVEIEKTAAHYEVKVGCVDIGQGNYTAFAQLAAEALDVDLDRIRLVAADTKRTHDCGTTAASRTTFIVGNAILAAAKEVKEQLGEGIAFPKGIGKAVFPASELTHLGVGLPHMMYTFIAQAVKIKVDPYTGGVTLLDVFAVTEAGRILNPMGLSGQIEGGIGMSVGYCLTEEMTFSDGVTPQKNFSTYLLPTSLDLCSITCATVDAREDSGPYGVKGAAEVSTVAIAPAITGAVSAVTGLSLTSLPVSREKVLQYFLEEVIFQ